jgi:L-alanine-DL-glutamate epimerase-like enolase superfamily enzyme
MFGSRIVTGEQHLAVSLLRKDLTAEAVNILNHDMAGVGVDMLDFADMAHGRGVLISPRCWVSQTAVSVGVAALHAGSTIANADLANIHLSYKAVSAEHARVGADPDAHLAMSPDNPGLGVDVDLRALLRNVQVLFRRASHVRPPDQIVSVPL